VTDFAIYTNELTPTFYNTYNSNTTNVLTTGGQDGSACLEFHHNAAWDLPPALDLSASLIPMTGAVAGDYIQLDILVGSGISEIYLHINGNTQIWINQSIYDAGWHTVQVPLTSTNITNIGSSINRITLQSNAVGVSRADNIKLVLTSASPAPTPSPSPTPTPAPAPAPTLGTAPTYTANADTDIIFDSSSSVTLSNSGGNVSALSGKVLFNSPSGSTYYLNVGRITLDTPVSVTATDGDEIYFDMAVTGACDLVTLRFNNNYVFDVITNIPTNVTMGRFTSYGWILNGTQSAFPATISTIDVSINSNATGEVVISNIRVIRTNLGSLPRPTGAPRIVNGIGTYPADTIFTTDISNVAVETRGAGWLTNLGAAHLHFDYGNGGVYGIPVNYDAYSGWTYIDFNATANAGKFYAEDQDLATYAHFPHKSTYVREAGSDHHLIVADSSNTTPYVYECHKYYDSTTGQPATGDLDSDAWLPVTLPYCTFAIQINLKSYQMVAPSRMTSADLAGLPIQPLLLKVADIATGNLTHTIRFTALSGQIGGSVVPANLHVSSGASARHSLNGLEGNALNPSFTGIPLGAILRLKASSLYKLDTMNVYCQRVGYGLRHHGMVNADIGGPLFLTCEADPAWDSIDLSALESLTGNDFEPIDAMSIMVKPTGYQVQAANVLTCNLTSPTAGTKSGTVTLTATATDTVGVSNVQFQLNGNNFGSPITSAPYTLDWDTTLSINGDYVITAIATNTSSAVVVSSSVTVTVSNTDIIAPTVSISSPANNANVNGTITISATASDNLGVIGVQFKVDGNNIGTEDLSSPFSKTLDTTTLSNGSHTLTAIARDGSNNSTTSSPITIVVNNVDIIAPTVSITSPSSGVTLSGATNAVTATASDNIVVAGVQFKINNANLGAEDTSAPYSTNLDTTAYADGDYTLTAVATDGTGNATTSAPINIVINNSGVGTFTSNPLLDLSGNVKPNLLLNYVALYDVTTGALVVRKTNVYTNSQGIFSITDSAITPGTEYKADWEDENGGYRLAKKVAL
jgi:hypothetical protein